MKIACLVTGQPRHSGLGLVELKKFMGDLDVDYFNHHWLDESTHGVEQYSANKGEMSIWSTDENTKNNILNILNPKKFKFEKQIVFEPKRSYEPITKTNQKPWQFMSMTYSKKIAFELMESYIDMNSNSYDFVFVTRTDLSYSSTLSAWIDKCNPDTFYTPYEPGEHWNIDHLNDPFVMSSLNNIRHYCSLFDDFDKHWVNGVDFCAHRLSMAQMKEIEEIKFDSILQKQDWSYIRKI